MRVDLALGIGGFILGDTDCEVECEIMLELGQPYVPGQTELKILHFDGKIELIDLYDWDLRVNPAMALMQAGHGTYGDGGKPFVVEVPYEGLLPMSDNSRDPNFHTIPFGIK